MPNPLVTEKPAAAPASADDPFAAPPAKAVPANGKKAGDPFADEPPAKAASDAQAAPNAKATPDAKGPLPAGKGAPEMKKEEDPFKL